MWSGFDHNAAVGEPVDQILSRRRSLSVLRFDFRAPVEHFGRGGLAAWRSGRAADRLDSRRSRWQRPGVGQRGGQQGSNLDNRLRAWPRSCGQRLALARCQALGIDPRTSPSGLSKGRVSDPH